MIIVKIVRVLGEGGFSFVYLAEDEHSGVGFRIGDNARSTELTVSSTETICFEEDSMSKRTGGCPTSHARSRSI